MNERKRQWATVVLGLGMTVALAGSLLGAPKKKETPVWTDAGDTTVPACFTVQGEYLGQTANGAKLGCQVISLGNGAFQAVFLPGGLPGEGWDGKTKLAVDGRTEGGATAFAPTKGPKKYLGGSPQEFSALDTNPPAQPDYTAAITGDTMAGKTDAGVSFELKKVLRESLTLGAKPPAGAIVLFDGTNTDAWNGGRLDEQKKVLCTDGKDIRTKQKFSDYTMHVEFTLPYRPEARGQGRGNSGFYQVDMYEVQVLDSFGLAGKNNECGGIYKNADPKVNMCYPPLTWQTYDIEFRNARADENGQRTEEATVTLRHNGVVIHDAVQVNGPTGGNRKEPEGTPGPIKFQGHGNPLQYRNVWIVEK